MSGRPLPLADQLTPTGAGLAEDLDWIASILGSLEDTTPSGAPDSPTDVGTPPAAPPQPAAPDQTGATDAIPVREPPLPMPAPTAVPPVPMPPAAPSAPATTAPPRLPHAGIAPVTVPPLPSAPSPVPPPLPTTAPARPVRPAPATPPALPSGTCEPVHAIGPDDTDDPAAVLETVADPETAARPDRRRRSIMMAVAAVLCAAMLATVIAWAAGTHRACTAQTRLDQAVASLRAADTKAATARRKAVAAGVGEKDTTPLSKRIGLDRKLIARADTPMDAGSDERLTRSLVSAERQTTRLTSELEQATRTALTAAAKARCRTALDKAEQARRDTAGLTGDQTVNAEAVRLDTAIKAAGGLGAKTTASQWDSMAARLDEARDTLTKAADAKRAADQAAQAQAETQAQAEAKAKEEAKPQTPAPAQTTPAPATPKRQASTPRATANPKPLFVFT